MSTIGIIAEYNPFHNGHQYMMNEAKKITGADNVVIALGGSFLQRGEAALCGKYERAEFALKGGADLIFELPFAYASGSAGDFANGAVRLLDGLGIIDYLCFGAETDNEELLYKIADILAKEPEDFSSLLKAKLATGLSFPAARAKALSDYIGTAAEHITALPNNILAIEYLTAIKKLNSKLKPVIIKRRDAAYHESRLTGAIGSASAIRNELVAGNLTKVSTAVPDFVYDFFRTRPSAVPIKSSTFTPFIQSALINTQQVFSDFCDVDTDLSDKLIKLSPIASYDEIISSLLSKNYTKSRISRCLIHIINGYTNADRRSFFEGDYIFYANLLGLKKDKSFLVKQINESSNIPVITKKADFNKIIEADSSHINTAKRMWELDLKATSIYNCLVFNQCGIKNGNDYNTIIPVI